MVASASATKSARNQPQTFAGPFAKMSYSGEFIALETGEEIAFTSQRYRRGDHYQLHSKLQWPMQRLNRAIPSIRTAISDRATDGDVGFSRVDVDVAAPSERRSENMSAAQTTVG